MTKAIYGELNIYYQSNKDDFVFFGCMKAPLKKLQNKYRYQVLMRIKDLSNKTTDIVYSVINKYNTKNISAYMEINPNNLN